MTNDSLPSVSSNPSAVSELSPRRPSRASRVWFLAAAAVAVAAGGAAWLWAEQQPAVGAPSAAPNQLTAFIPTRILFTATINDQHVRERSVRLVKTDVEGNPTAIVARLQDDGRKGDQTARDYIFSKRIELTERSVGSVYFRVAARFVPPPGQIPTQEEQQENADENEFSEAAMNSGGSTARTRLLRHLQRYVLSAPVAVVVDPFPAIGPNAANPDYIVVNTPTTLAFTSQIPIPTLKDRSVVLVRLNASGQPVDVIGRLKDDGQGGDAVRNDKTFTLRASLNEPAIGRIQFKVAAKFRPNPRSADPTNGDVEDEWDADLTALNDPRDPSGRPGRLARLLQRITERYVLSEPIQVTVGPVPLPPDPGEPGKQTIAGIDSDNDGIRDDVQRFIVLNHIDSRRTIAALSQSARSLQAFVTANPLERDLLMEMNQDLRRSNDCLEYVAGTTAGASLFGDLLAETLNTPSRSGMYTRAQRSSGARGYMLTSDNQLRDGCRFNPDASQ